MSRDNWITIGGIIVTAVLTAINLAVSWRNAKRPIQIILLTNSPAANDAKDKFLRRLRWVFILSTSTIVVAVFWLTIRFVSSTPIYKHQLYMTSFSSFALAFNAAVLVAAFRWRKKYLALREAQKVEQDASNPAE